MNILYLKYALEVARTGSINKAAENLSMAQPNLSRAIKELEASLGTAVFDRTSRGMTLTRDGERLIGYAEKILGEVDELEAMFCDGGVEKLTFSIAAPYADYISGAFAEFTNVINKSSNAELIYREASSHDVIEYVVHGECHLGIVRYSESDDKYFKELLESKALCQEFITDFSYKLLFSTGSPLASLEKIGFADLSGLTEILRTDPFELYQSSSHLRKSERNKPKCRVYAQERASRLNILSSNVKTFMWVSSLSKRQLDRYGLKQKSCTDNNVKFKDVLIYRSDYHLSDIDKNFITLLCDKKREVMP